MKKLALAVLLLAGAPLAIAATTKARNWLATTAVTPGGHRIGNPAAPKKLIELVSYTCPHCGHFFKEADGAMKLAYIQPGKVSVEIHHIIRDPVDLTAAVLAECGPSSKFFGNHDMFFSQQDKWLAKAKGLSRAQQRRWYDGPLPQRLRAVASDFGFYDMMETRGYSRAQADACLGNEKKANALLAQSEADGDKFNAHGTPTFVLNGKTLDVYTWDELQKLLSPA
jgi:protein-disulfide isomerase